MNFLKNHQIILNGRQVGPHIWVWISFMQKFLLEMRKNMAVGVNTKSTKPYKKTFILFYCDVLVPAQGLDLDQDRSQRCERTEFQVKREPI